MSLNTFSRSPRHSDRLLLSRGNKPHLPRDRLRSYTIVAATDLLSLDDDSRVIFIGKYGQLHFVSRLCVTGP